jgi:hypothetical protein
LAQATTLSSVSFTARAITLTQDDIARIWTTADLPSESAASKRTISGFDPIIMSSACDVVAQ